MNGWSVFDGPAESGAGGIGSRGEPRGGGATLRGGTLDGVSLGDGGATGLRG
jgi:hypothetical protein